MPFVKVSDTLVVNTNAIKHVRFNSKHGEITFREDNEIVGLEPAAVAVLFDLLEVSQAFNFNPDMREYKQTLTTRLAQTLRDTQPYGATVAQLSALVNETEEATEAALQSLAEESVTKNFTQADTENGDLWFHASHAPKPMLVCTTCHHLENMHSDCLLGCVICANTEISCFTFTPSPDLSAATVAPVSPSVPGSES